MAEQSPYRYGTPNWEMLGRWLELPASDDGPFFALNLMKYRERADYGDGDGPDISGREADDAYTPVGPLAAIGAVIAFAGDVVEQESGRPRWDRVGIVRYPSRAAFFEMQRRDDFKAKHVHKEAGMEFTIVMSCLPESAGEFAVEGVIVGDDRRYDRAAITREGDRVRLTVHGTDSHVVLIEPTLDRLAETVEGATT